MVDHYALGYSAGYELPFTPPPFPSGTPPSTPDLRVLIDFVNDIFPQTPQWYSSVSNAPIWTDVTDRVRGGSGITSIRRGRERPLDRNEAGIASIVLDNWDRVFDPEASNAFAISPLMRRIRFEAGFARTTTAFKMASSKVGGTDLVGGGASTIWEPIYDGVIESIEFDYPALGNDAIATIKCMDLLGVMAKDELSGSIGIDFVAPVNALNIALNYRPYTGRRGPDPLEGYPYNTTQEGDRDVGERFSVLTSAGNPCYVLHLGTYQGQPMRAAVDDVAAADGGNFYISRGGICTYRDHDWPLRPAGKIRVAVDAEKFADMDRVMDETLIYNYVYLVGSGHVPPPFGADPGAPYAVLEDPGSQARYLRREWPVSTDCGLYFQNHIDDRAEQILLRYREPQVYLAKLDMSNLVTDWEQMLTADLWDIVTVEVTLPNGDVVEQRSMIEGIEISTPSRNLWNLVWWLSLPVFPNLFSPNDYSFEGFDVLTQVASGSIGDWTAETNCTIRAEDTQLEEFRHGGGRNDLPIYYTYDIQYVYASRGIWVLEMDAVTDGTISALSPVVEIDDRQVYVGKVQARVVRFGGDPPTETLPATPPPLQNFTRSVTLELDWYDANMVFLSKAVGTATSVPGLPITGWTTVKVDARAPNSAAFVQMRVKSAGSGRAGLFVDEATLKRGA